MTECENIWIASSDGDIETVSHHINSGISVNVQDDSGYSPMHAAASYGHLELLKWLIERGGDIHLRDNDGDTPLLVCENGDTFSYLVSCGADPAAKNTAGEGILEKAVEDENDEFIEFLVSAGYAEASQIPAARGDQMIDWKIEECEMDEEEAEGEDDDQDSGENEMDEENEG